MDSSCNNTVVDDLSERTSETSVDGFSLSELLVLVASTVIHPHEPLSSLYHPWSVWTPGASCINCINSYPHSKNFPTRLSWRANPHLYRHWHYELHGEQKFKFLRLFSANRSNRPWPPTTIGAWSSTVHKILRQFFATRAYDHLPPL